ncbi:MAG: hypothetical protein ACI4PG_08645 [Candidatus Ventricola sp.]
MPDSGSFTQNSPHSRCIKEALRARAKLRCHAPFARWKLQRPLYVNAYFFLFYHGKAILAIPIFSC